MEKNQLIVEALTNERDKQRQKLIHLEGVREIEQDKKYDADIERVKLRIGKLTSLINKHSE